MIHKVSFYQEGWEGEGEGEAVGEGGRGGWGGTPDHYQGSPGGGMLRPLH